MMTRYLLKLGDGGQNLGNTNQAVWENLDPDRNRSSAVFAASFDLGIDVVAAV